MATETWVSAGELADLDAKGRKLIKHNGRQVAIFNGSKGLFACNNRCPHEGYPLVEGNLTDGCVLTCNWHNWKFDLSDGSTLVGGDAVVTFPVQVRDGEVFVDVSGPSVEARRAGALKGLRDSFRRDERDRIAREIARLRAADGDPLDAVRLALDWAHVRFEFGTTHAIAAAPDWLCVRDRHAGDEAERLMALTEIVGHLNWDSLREPEYPYADGVAPFAADALVAAIEAEDEPAAIRMTRGALRDGVAPAEIFKALSVAALNHYANFGHSAIYTLKTEQLLERLGESAAEPLLLALARSLAMAPREDLIPEFKAYAPALKSWNGAGRDPVRAKDFEGLGVRAALDRCLASSADPLALYSALLHAAALQWLGFDLAAQARTDNPVSRNIGWLDYTHAITFANAARRLCARDPGLWPAALLQLACFLGRNVSTLDPEVAPEDWRVDDPDAFLRDGMRGLFDHARQEFIVSAHLVKILTAIEDEIAAQPAAPWRDDLLAAFHRMSKSPLKRRHALRSARQALEFVARE